MNNFDNILEIVSVKSLIIIPKTGTLVFSFRDLMVEGDSLSSTLAGLRESYYDYNIPKPTEI